MLYRQYSFTGFLARYSFLCLRSSIWDHYLLHPLEVPFIQSTGGKLLGFFGLFSFLSENVFILALFWNGIFTGYKILGWQLFSFSTLKTRVYCPLVSLVIEKLIVSLSVILLVISCIFTPLLAFRIFSYVLCKFL